MQMYHVHATTIPDAWFQLVYNLMRGDVPHQVYEIDKGSYVGQKRLEYDFITVQIDHPYERPLIPEMPPSVNVPPPVEDMDYVEDYFTRYLMGTELEENETYIYGTWLAPGIERVIEQLNGAPGNNQAAICIGGMALADPAIEITGYLGRTLLRLENPVDTDNFIDPGTGQRDPACLRVVDFRYDQAGFLHMFVYFRSWDLWGGFPANLAGLQMVSEYVAQEIGAKPGRLLAASKGLHLYSHAIQVAASRVGMQDVDSMEDFLNAMEKEKEGN